MLYSGQYVTLIKDPSTGDPLQFVELEVYGKMFDGKLLTTRVQMQRIPMTPSSIYLSGMKIRRALSRIEKMYCTHSRLDVRKFPKAEQLSNRIRSPFLLKTET